MLKAEGNGDEIGVGVNIGDGSGDGEGEGDGIGRVVWAGRTWGGGLGVRYV